MLGAIVVAGTLKLPNKVNSSNPMEAKMKGRIAEERTEKDDENDNSNNSNNHSGDGSNYGRPKRRQHNH